MSLLAIDNIWKPLLKGQNQVFPRLRQIALLRVGMIPGQKDPSSQPAWDIFRAAGRKPAKQGCSLWDTRGLFNFPIKLLLCYCSLPCYTVIRKLLYFFIYWRKDVSIIFSQWNWNTERPLTKFGTMWVSKWVIGMDENTLDIKRF